VETVLKYEEAMLAWEQLKDEGELDDCDTEAEPENGPT
jgi:hypothetical protein